MNVQALSMARRLFIVQGVPTSTQRHNIRSWVRSVRFLGDNWLISKPVERK
jgi:hypothetical protein